MSEKEVKLPEETKTEKKETTLKVNKMAYIETISLHDFIEAGLLNKAFSEKVLETYLWEKKKPSRIIELMDWLMEYGDYIEEDILVKIFHEKFGYELHVDINHNIPAILKGMFNEWKPSEDKFFKKEDARNILNMDIVPLDINGDTLTLLMRTPEVPKDFPDKIMPLMKSKNIKNIKIKLTNKDIFDYYKENITYNVINNVL